MIRIWDFSKISVTVDGIAMADWGADTAVTFADSRDKASQVVSLSKGSVIYNELNDTTGTATFTILANSDSYNELYNKWKTVKGVKTFDIIATNRNDGSLSSSLKSCYFKTMPSPELAREVTTLAIEIFYADKQDYKDTVA